MGKKLTKLIYSVSFVVIIFFSIVGTMFLSIVFHELSHKQDLERYVTDEGEMCFFAYPVNATLKEIIFGDYSVGYYMYDWKSNLSKEIKEDINKYSEEKAMLISIIIFIVLVICIYIEMIRRIRSFKAEEFNEFFYKWMEEQDEEKDKN